MPTSQLALAGRPSVRVPLINQTDQSAVVDAADLEALRAAGYSTRWFLNRSGSGHPYVRVASRRYAGGVETVARIILQPGRNRVVSYRDGDPLNLRRANLMVMPGRAKGQRLAPSAGDAE